MNPKGVIVVVEIVIPENTTVISVDVFSWYEFNLVIIISNVVIITNIQKQFILKLRINMNFSIFKTYFDKCINNLSIYRKFNYN